MESQFVLFVFFKVYTSLHLNHFSFDFLTQSKMQSNFIGTLSIHTHTPLEVKPKFSPRLLTSVCSQLEASGERTQTFSTPLTDREF